MICLSQSPEEAAVQTTQKGMFRAKAFLLGILIMLMFPVVASSKDDDASRAKSAVEHVLLTQQDAWNHHDLDAFMTGYWNSPDLTFFSGAKESKGWQATLDRYRATYTGSGHEMGKLDFSDLRVEILGPDAAFVRGVWQLAMSDGKTPHGRFTLIFRKFPNGWKIIHDHTSAAD
jgi:beta-aspartyl-peptidase (threonine type)